MMHELEILDDENHIIDPMRNLGRHQLWEPIQGKKVITTAIKGKNINDMHQWEHKIQQ